MTDSCMILLFLHAGNSWYPFFVQEVYSHQTGGSTDDSFIKNTVRYCIENDRGDTDHEQ